MTKDLVLVLEEGEGARTVIQLLQDRSLDDDENPRFILRGVKTSLLRRIAEGTIDLAALAKCDLKAKGLKEP